MRGRRLPDHFAGGFNVNGGTKMVACVTYANTGYAAGDYFLEFNGTSSATPITAGGADRRCGVDAADARVRVLRVAAGDRAGFARVNASR